MNDKRKEKTENDHDYDVIKSKPVTLTKKYKFFNRNIFFRILGLFAILFIYLFFYLPAGKLFYRIKVKNKKAFKKMKKTGAIMVSNHILPMDAFFHGCIAFPSKMYITMLQGNLGIPVAGKLFRVAGGVPIPESIELMPKFNEEMKQVLNNNKVKVMVYPEAALKPYCDHIRNFKNGAFRWAYDCNVPIIPVVITYRKPKKRKKPYLTFNYLEPEYIIEKETKYETINDLKMRVHTKMTEYFVANSEIRSEEND